MNSLEATWAVYNVLCCAPPCLTCTKADMDCNNVRETRNVPVPCIRMIDYVRGFQKHGDGSVSEDMRYERVEQVPVVVRWDGR